MSLPEKLKAQYLARLDELITSGETMPMKQHSRMTSRNVLSGETHYRHYDLAAWPEFVEWRTTCIAVLDHVVPQSSLLRKTVDALHSLGHEPSKVEFATSFLKSVRKELQAGSLGSLANQIEAEVLADYLGQAEAFLSGTRNGKEHVAAAVVAGAALERCLRTLSLSLVPPEPITSDKGAPLGMSAVIEALKRRQVYNELQAKELRAWAAIRNAAAHGEFDAFTPEQVETMVPAIGRFMRERAL
jgi:hypothetical protein